MLFSKRKYSLPDEINVRINNKDIQSVTEFSFLGFYLNSKLNWDTHVNVMSKKMSRAVGIIKNCNCFFQRILISLYNTLILPHIDYCLLSWGSSNAAESIFGGKRRLYVLFQPLVIMHILNRFLKFLTL